MISIKKITISHFLISIATICIAFVSIFPFNDTIMNLIRVSGGILCLLWALFVSEKRHIIITLEFCILLSIAMIIGILYNGNSNLVNILWIWSYWGIALLAFNDGISTKQSKVIFYICCLIYLYKSYKDGVIYNEDVLMSGSNNNISIICIFCLSMYNLSISIENKKKQLSYIPILLIFIISAWGSNRSGIVCSVIYLLLLIFVNLKKSSLPKLIFPLIILSITFIFIIQNYFETFLNILNKFDKYNGFESGRSDIWLEYFQGTFKNLGNFIFGPPCKQPQSPLLNLYEGNTHNTYLMLHSRYGILCFVIILYTLLKAFILIVKTKNYILLITFIIIALRSMFDWTGFPGFYDTIFYYMILYYKNPNYKPFYESKELKVKNSHIPLSSKDT